METNLFDLSLERHPAKARSHRFRYGHMENQPQDNGFVCKNCHAYVSTAAMLSGTQNRNHCPYCLWSRHVDLRTPGDRLSACKSSMRPIGLTTKATNKRYASSRGELMLVHLCTECDRLSINRIAADDIPEKIMDIFESAGGLDASLQGRLEDEGIRILHMVDVDAVRAQLFGQHID